MNLVNYLKNLVFKLEKAKKGHGEIKSTKDLKSWRCRIQKLNEKNISIKNCENELIDLEAPDNRLKAERAKNFRTYFFSVDFILFLFTEMQQKSRQFGELLNDFSYISFSTGDVFSEFFYAEKIKK